MTRAITSSLSNKDLEPTRVDFYGNLHYKEGDYYYGKPLPFLYNPYSTNRCEKFCDEEFEIKNTKGNSHISFDIPADTEITFEFYPKK